MEKQEKPRGKCTGCAFEYQLSRVPSGPYKGLLVTRKHNSRVGPGLCEGAQKPPAIKLGEATGDAQAFTDPAPVTETELEGQSSDDRRWAAISNLRMDHDPVDGRKDLFRARHTFHGSCRHPVVTGELTVPDGKGHFLCHACGVVETEDVSNAVEMGQELGRHLAEAAAPTPVTEELTVCLGCPDVTGRGDHTDCGPRASDITLPLEAFAGTAPAPVPEFADPAPVSEAIAVPAPVTEFVDPAPMPAEMTSVNGQPEEERDRWSRYLLPGPNGTKVPHTRTTTFVKLGSSTYALGEWNERMLIKGLVERPDLLAMAHGMDVKRDRVRMNALIDDAQKHAGNKVAANIGSAYHAFTERLDAGVMTLEDVPPQWRGRCAEYVAKLAEYDLTTRREWIERTTAVRADQVSAPLPVAGKLDRILQLPNGDLVIGDLKTSSNIEYGWSEIAAQLAVYAHGVNTHGLYDWNTKSWGPVAWDRAYHPDTPAVRTDYAIVMHLPADGEGCHLYRVDLVKGWAFAQVSGRVQARQKDKSVAAALTVLDVQAPPVAVGASDLLPDTPVMSASVKAADLDVMTKAAEVIGTAQTRAELAPVYEYAATSGRFTAYQLGVVKRWCAERWEQLPA